MTKPTLTALDCALAARLTELRLSPKAMPWPLFESFLRGELMLVNVDRDAGRGDLVFVPATRWELGRLFK